MSRRKLSRRQFVAATALSFRSADHGLIFEGRMRRQAHHGLLGSLGADANKASTALVNEWAKRRRSRSRVDYITSNGRKNEITIAAEAQAKSAMTFSRWQPLVAALAGRAAEPMKRRGRGRSSSQNGAVNVPSSISQGRSQVARVPPVSQPDQGALARGSIS